MGFWDAVAWAGPPCSRQTITSTPHHSIFYSPDALPDTQLCQGNEGRYLHEGIIYMLMHAESNITTLVAFREPFWPFSAAASVVSTSMSSLGGGTWTTTGLEPSESLLTNSTYIGPEWLFRCIWYLRLAGFCCTQKNDNH